MDIDTVYSDTTCPMGCIFYNGKLQGDCRAPYRVDCALKVHDAKKLAENLSKITEFCVYCGAGIGVHRREGEGTCGRCDHKGKDWTPGLPCTGEECPVCFGTWGECEHTSGELYPDTDV